MSDDAPGVRDLDLVPGEYAFEPAEWRRDAKQQLGALGSGSGEDDEPVWHLHDVERADGTLVMEVVEDRRAMEGALQTSGRQFLFRSPGGDPLVAYEREGHVVGTTTTLEDSATGEVLASWEAPGLLSRLFKSRWVLSDADGTRQAVAKRAWSLGSLSYPTYDLTVADGTDVGVLAVERDGAFHRMDVTLERSPVPTGVLLAMAYGIFWATNQDSSGGSSGG